MVEEQVDYIVVGAGSGGCVIASRLTEDPGISVCLLEAGKPDKNILIHAPAGCAAMLPTKMNNWAYHTIPQKGLNGRRGYQPRGKTLGGSSSINAMMYARGHRWDYDHWESLGNPGWSYEALLPYFKKSEHNETHKGEFHGQGGPLNIAELVSPSCLNPLFIQACAANGIPHNPDVNGAEQFGAMQTQVNQKGGERHSVAKAYLTPNLNRRNLQVKTQILVSRILLENNCATGIEFLENGQLKTLKARKEIVLCGGAFGTPQLLMLSGVGPQQHLREKGIKPMLDLPGVGENLQDHPDIVHTYRTPSDTDTFGYSIRGSLAMAKAIPQYMMKRRGKITSNFAEGIAFAKSEAELEIPDLELVFVVGIVDDHNRKLHLGHGYSCHVTLLRPKSRGWVKLMSANPTEPPLIHPNFLGEDEDLQTLMKGWHLQKRILESKPFDPIRRDPLYPVDAADPQAVIDDIRNRTDTQYHPVGTCKMGPDSDPLAVVDHQLRVRGIANLRIADASIMPTLIGGNTNAPTVAIAEKAVDMMKEKLPHMSN